MSLTPEQLRAARAETSVAITAGAGTGKTHTLGHRYLHHLESGLSPLQIVAVTFTEKASAELRARVRAYVRRHLPDRPDALVELEAAQISTIHALAARICRDHPEAAEVPPDFAVLEELEGQVWLAERLEEALAELPGKLFAQLPYHHCKETLELLLGEPVLAEAALARGRDAWPELVRQARDTALQALQSDAEWCEAASVARGAVGETGDKAETARHLAIQGLDLLAKGETSEGLDCLDAIDLRGGSQKAWPDGDLTLVKAALKLLREQARAALKEGLVVLELGEADDRLAALLPHLCRAFDQVCAALQRGKRQQRVLDFSDLEAHALKALEQAEVRTHYAQRWQAVLVDEFQDTNPVQEALLRQLTEGLTLTIVGDEKQGIYGFRGADVAVFRRTRERICAGGGQEIVLRQSFRSHTPLVNTVNATFRPVLGELHQDLEAFRPQAPHAAPHLRLFTVQSERGSSKAQRQVIEARAIAGHIREMLDTGLKVHDKASGTLRPIRPSDIAVLTRTWTPLDSYSEVLPGMSVPAVHTGGGSLLDTREAKDCLALLRFLADPRDNLALAALLRSPFFACSDPALYTSRAGSSP